MYIVLYSATMLMIGPSTFLEEEEEEEERVGWGVPAAQTRPVGLLIYICFPLYLSLSISEYCHTPSRTFQAG